MISPATDACGSSLPSTAHSISRAFGTPASMTILRSKSAARRTAAASSSAVRAGADVGYVRELEEPLHGAVFTVRPVQHREDHVEADAGDDRRCPLLGH